MVESRISRIAAETVGDEPVIAGVTRLDAIIASLRAGPSAQRVNISRCVAEAVGVPPISVAVSRLDGLLVGLRAAPAPTRVNLSRVISELVGGLKVEGAVSRLDATIASLRVGPGPSTVNVSRIMAEAVAPQGSAGPIVPLPLAAGFKALLHNWVSKVDLRSSYTTDVSVSPATGAESRRGLVLKPFRTMKLQWQFCGGTDSALEDLACLERFLARIEDGRFQVPLYPDQVETSAAYLGTDDTLAVDTDKGRWFPGGRIVIVETGVDSRVESFTTHIIASTTSTTITLTSTLAVVVPVGALVFPLIDCEVLLSAKTSLTSARGPQVALTVQEVQGNNTLPPLKSDNPVATDTFEGLPIWTFEPDWSGGIEKQRVRAGSSRTQGRAPAVLPHAARARQGHIMTFNGKRDDMWPLVEFFDTRRGRLRPFWLVDQDQYMTTLDVDAVGGQFISVSEVGTLADFANEFDHVGILLDDGRYFVRGVSNIQAILTSFRITLNAPLPSGLLPGRVIRIAKARTTRFEKDEMLESWVSTGYMTTKLRFIELLNERTAEI